MVRKGGQKGNSNAKKGSMFRDALHKVLARDKGALERIARALVMRAGEGDLAAIREIADRLDGKPTPIQTIVGEDDTPSEFKFVIRRHGDEQH